MTCRLLLHLAAATTALALPASTRAQRAPSAAAVDAVFAPYSAAGSPGCALGVARQGQMLYERGYGLAELEWGIPITPATVFNVGSVSKQFVAASIALLAERGQLALDDDVRKYVPELPRYQAAITLRHLLHHTSGIRDMLELMYLAGVDINTHHSTDEYLGLLARQKELNFTPGSQHLYSNSGYFLLGLVVQRVSGMSLRSFADRNIFAPLGMKDTHFHDDARMIIPRRAQSYARSGDHWVLDYSTNFDRVGPGGVNTTVRDMALWDHSFDTGILGGPAFRATMLTRGVLTNGDTIPYALALVHGEQDGLRTISHGGSSLGFRAQYLRFPEQGLAVIVLCNTPANPARLAAQVARLYLGDRMRPSPMATRQGAGDPEGSARDTKAVPMTPAELDAFVGEYRSEELDATFRLALRDGRLFVRRTGADDVPLTPIGGRRFRGDLGTLEFSDNAASGFRLQGGRIRNVVFSRRTAAP